MVEKILSLKEIRELKPEDFNLGDFKRLDESLNKIGFFEKTESEDYDNFLYTVLRLTPDETDSLNGQGYIRKDLRVEDKSKSSITYDFDLKPDSICVP